MLKLAIIIFLLFSTISPISADTSIKFQNDVTCLAEAIYRESRGESLKGKLAVGQVVLNRVKSSLYPSSICAVIFQKDQFSWTRTFNKYIAPKEFKYLAHKIIMGKHSLANFSATHFHATYVSPKWKNKLVKIATIGNHIFYKL